MKQDQPSPESTEPTSAGTLEALKEASALQNAGRLKEAFALCQEITKSDPDNADAYNIGGVIAFQGGKTNLGLSLLRKAVAADPAHVGALNNLGIVLKETGALAEAVKTFEQAIALNAHDADAHFNLGNALATLERHDAAAEAYGRAAACRPAFADALHNRAVMLSLLERFDEAADLLRQVIAISPDFADAHFQLASVLDRLEQDDETLKAIAKAVALRPDHADTVHSQANMLANRKHYDEAAATYRKLVAISPEFVEAHNKLGRVLFDSGKPAEAIEPFTRVLELDPTYTRAQFSLLASVLNGLGPDALLETCNTRLAADSRDRYALAAKAIALTDLGQKEAARALLDFDRFIRQIRLEAPMGYPSLEAFNAALSEHVCTHPTLEFEKTGHATRSGGHTAHINDNAEFPVAVLEQAVRDQVAEYMKALPDDPSHPFVADRPDRWKIHMWAVVMQTQGHQLPHIHPAAWLSGVYYPKLPDVIDQPTEDKEGWIEFGRSREMLEGAVEPETVMFKPEEGLMLLFPGYFFHGTVPYHTDQTRVSIAFDIVPTD